MASERIRKNATVEIGIVKMTEKDFKRWKQLQYMIQIIIRLVLLK